jgi:hypothetical protein
MKNGVFWDGATWRNVPEDTILQGSVGYQSQNLSLDQLG